MQFMILIFGYRFLVRLSILSILTLYSPFVWSQETDQDMPVAAVGGTVHADLFTGTATTSIPIEVPPGRQGVQPQLALTYGSANGNSWTGMGWKLEKEVIERQTKFGVNYNKDDYVMRLSGINVDLVTVDTDEFRAKYEGNFTRVQKKTDSSDGKPYFVATDKTGKTYRFGYFLETRVYDPNNSNRIFRWCLDRVEDTYGNYMTISYTTDQNQGYLARIDYTGHGSTLPTNSVIFHLENRSDSPPMYVPNFQMKTAKRLKTIETRANNNFIKAYKLDYSSSPTTGRSILTTVRSYGSDTTVNASGDIVGGTSLPPVTLTSSEADNSFASPSVWLTGSGTANQHNQFPGDFNGDGKQDWMYRNGDWYVALSNGQGFDPPTVWLTGSGTVNQGNQFVADFNGDGKQDWMYLNGSWYVALSNGQGFDPPTVWLSGSGIFNTGNQFPADFNGDGKTDWMYLNGSWYVALSNGQGFDPPTIWLSGSGIFNTHNQFVADFNGDGKTDWMYLNGSWYVTLSNGQGFDPPTIWLSGSGIFNTHNQFVADFNGDGKQDWMYLNGSWYIALSNGQGFDPPTVWLSGSGIFNTNYQFVADFSGDGKRDFMYLNGNWHVAKRDGSNDLLENMTNGLGATTTIEYTPSTEYSNTQLPFVTQTVSKITTNDGNSNVAITTYDYEGGFHHIEDRDFRGFNKVTAHGPIGQNSEQVITITEFHQGNDTEVGVNNPNVLHGYLKGAPYRTRVEDPNGNPYSVVTISYTDDDDQEAPFFAPPSSIITNIHDGNSTFKQTQTDYQYDEYGNVLREDQYGDTATNFDDKTITRTFSPNTTDWILGLATSETIYESLGTGGTQMAKTDFYYDGTTSCTSASSNLIPSHGKLTRTVQYLNGNPGPEIRMAYDAMGNLSCTQDARGNSTTMSYDSTGTFAKIVTNALNHQVATQYYGVDGVSMDKGLYGQIKNVTDPNGAVTTTEYDVFGRPTKVTQPDLTTTTSYVAFGTVNSQHLRTDAIIGSTTLSTWTYFDGLGRTIKQKSTGTDGKNIIVETQYDARGAVTQTSTPYFEAEGSPLWILNTYDPLGRIIRTDNPDASRTLACFDDWVTVTIDAENHRKRVARDAYGRVEKVEEYEGAHPTCNVNVGTPYATTTYQSDALGNLRFLTDAKGNQTEMRYDSLSRKTYMDDPDMGIWTYQYDAMGNLIQQTDAENQQIHFQYDALNRRVQKDYEAPKALGSGDVVYTYDGSTNNRIGRLQQVTDSSGTTTFYYDLLGRVIRTDKVVDGTTYTSQTTHDGLGRVLTLTYPENSGTVTHTYNGPQLESVQEGSTTYATYSGFNALGQPSTLTYGNGVTTDYTYDPQNFRLKTLKTMNGSTVLQDLTYTFDDVGNVTGLTDTVHGNQTFVYDELNRLKTASGLAHPTPITYTYDEIGNMLSNSQVGNYAYPASGGSSERPHAVTSDGTHTYTYDANGNMTVGAGRTIAYDHENRPISIITSGNGSSGGGGNGTSIQINFQPSGSSVPTGYVKDDGAVYDSGRGYGWTTLLTGNTRERGSQPDQRLDTFVYSGNATWQYDLPNGDYLITLASGDPDWFQGPHEVVVEGTLVLEPQSTNANEFITVTDYPITVTDGQLTVQISPTASGNTMLNYIIITETGGGGDATPSAPGAASVSDITDSSLMLTWGAASDDIGISGYDVQRCIGAGCTNYTTLATVLSPSLTYTDNGLMADTTYGYAIIARDTADQTGPAVTTEGTTASPTPPSITAQINFQPSGSSVPTGYVKDDGAVYDSGRGYGWTTLLTGNTRERGSQPDQRLDTFVYSGNATWQYDLPNGDYLITLASGDPDWFQGPHEVVVEGTLVLGPQSTNANEFITVTDYPITIADGQLTVQISPTASGNTMLNYIIITEATTTALVVPPAPSYEQMTIQVANVDYTKEVSSYSKSARELLGWGNTVSSSVDSHHSVPSNPFLRLTSSPMISNQFATAASGTMLPVGANLGLVMAGMHNGGTSSTTTTFVYDGDGGRVKKTVDDGSLETATTYIGKLYVCNGTVAPLSCAKMIFAGGQRIAMVQVDGNPSPSTSYFHPDHLGSTSVLTDENAVKEQDVAYDPYGDTRVNESFVTPSVDVAYKYTGKEQDDSTGLYYYEARYYDPVLGRFISADTLVPDPSDPQTLNRYAYALNNPLRYTDPSGNFACGGVCIGIAVGAALGALQSGLASDWDLEATLTGAAIGGAAGAVGGAVGSYVGGVVGSKLTGVVGPVLAKAGGLAAGGIAGGAVGGLTSGVLSRAAGYDTDIGLTVAAGAAGGLAGGIVGAGGIQILGPDPAGVAIAMIAGSAAGGALSSTISGSDPGMGALFAAGGMALAIGARYIYQESQNHGNIQVQKLKKIASDLNQDLGKSGGRAILISLKGDNASCVSGNCLGISGKLTPIGPSGNTIDRYILTITAGNKTATGQIWQIRKIPVAGQFGTIVKDIPIQHYGEFSVLAGGEPFTINLGRPNFNGYIQLDISGTSNAANPAFNGVGRFEFKGYCSTFVNC